MNIAGNPAGRKEKGSLTQAVVIKSKSYGIHLVLNPDVTFQELLRQSLKNLPIPVPFSKTQM